MTIMVEIRPEVQAALARQAAARGCGLEAHAASLLEEAVHPTELLSHSHLDKNLALAAGARIRELSKA